MNVLSSMNTGNGIHLCDLMCILSRMPPFWLIQLVYYCKWLVRVASLLAPKPHLLLFSVLIGLASYTFQLPSICVLRTALMKFCSNNGGLLAGTSWHLLLEGSFARVLQRFPLPTYTDAVFNLNSFSKRAMQNQNWEKCVSRAVPNWDKVMFFFREESCWRTIIGTSWYIYAT